VIAVTIRRFYARRQATENAAFNGSHSKASDGNAFHNKSL